MKIYNSNDNIFNNKKKNLNNNNNINYILENNQKLNRHNHNFNIIITTKKNAKKTQTSPNNFISQISQKNIHLITSSNNMNKYEDDIISNYNPIKKNIRNNRSLQNSKSKNYYNNDTETNYNYNINNYNISSKNKPLNNFNPNLIKRKGTPTAGHQSIKINKSGIEKLMQKHLQLTLSISLHAPNDEIRNKIMPVNKICSVDELLNICRRYTEETSRRISFEYSMMSGVNDSDDNARELASKLRGMLCHVNLIPINEVEESPFKPSPPSRIKSFSDILAQSGISVTVRRKLGSDIDASCGQLRLKENRDRGGYKCS